jgi:hypothetical protein
MNDSDRIKSVSLDPLTPEEALRALLAVDPDADPAESEDRDDQGEEDDAKEDSPVK